MKITEKCKVIVAGSLVAALMTGTALPALAASPAGDVPFAVLAQQNSAVTPEQVEALISQIGTVTRSRRAAIVAALDAYNQLDDAGKAAVTNFGVLAEAQQILGIQDALAKCNVNYDAVEDCWAITTPHDDGILADAGYPVPETKNTEKSKETEESTVVIPETTPETTPVAEEETGVKKEEKTGMNVKGLAAILGVAGIAVYKKHGRGKEDDYVSEQLEFSDGPYVNEEEDEEEE